MRIIFLISLFLLSPFFASANVVINEIMYDLEGADKGREWIEIYNGGTEAVDLSGWKFYEGETNHRIKIVGEGNFIVSSGGFAVIADKPEKFLIDWPNFSGIIFDSSFSLKNSGEILIIRNSELSDIDKVDYIPAWGGDEDGNSLQEINGIWSGFFPTPGAQNSGAPQAEEQSAAADAEESVASEVEDEPAQEPVGEPAAANKEPVPTSDVEDEWLAEIAVEPEIQPVEIKQEITETESLPRKQESGGQKEVEETAGYSTADNGRNTPLKDNSADAQLTQNEEKNIEPAPFTVDETAQTANVITAVSDKVRSVEEWLVLILVIGMLAGIGTLFIRG